jgi:hypothetical protein
MHYKVVPEEALTRLPVVPERRHFTFPVEFAPFVEHEKVSKKLLAVFTGTPEVRLLTMPTERRPVICNEVLSEFVYTMLPVPSQRKW